MQIARRLRLPNNSPHGFTLVELLLATALTAVVMMAVYSSLDLYQRLMTAGRVDSERTQLKRALLEAMKRDIQSLVYYAPPETVGSSEATESADTEQAGMLSLLPADTSDESDTEEELMVQPGSGLYGDLTTLMLHVSRPPLAVQTVTADEMPATEVDLRSISWFLAVPNAPGLAGAVGNLASGGGMTMSRNSAVQGIARLQGASFALDYYDSQEATGLLAERAEILSDQVALLEFRYFDGIEWLESWDSDVMEGLPAAVEISIGFAPVTGNANSLGSQQASTVENQTGEITRCVIEMPLYAPQSTTDTTVVE
ncbi:prepilin-type N-terminal cleavage/methylation domain-containing protein [Rubinisphaera brasiliensis]|uniref:Type II secretion system protein J n=1 Tax=Rubinisphaera brasiliensis (strain ATCC 49424 / DSM 5305 / JCM 21570 / IAM 15109 / NBRC 103401 / IFAM 1448) TaxID=756272 RepID=F0SJH2_RUBBR|nr:prepilin-type N-terminal cleavage/methylation domain-containing protein [Rubinisphaera brasiliensis]ADY60784.1 hypothetical protein Plabr_3187 [Rubinisphaera brasiliensis DSM 5305]